MRKNIIRSCIVVLALSMCLHEPVAFAIQHSTGDKADSSLPAVLLDLVQTYHISVVAEISEPICQHISLPIPKRKSSLKSALNSIAGQCSGYIWTMDHGVVLFANDQLMAAPGNPMNIQLRSYSLPSDLNLFRLTFPATVMSHGEGGGAVEGFGLPKELSPQLKPRQYSMVTARTVVLDVAEQVRNLLSVLVFPSDHPVAKELGNNAFANWEVAGGAGMSLYKSHTFVRRPTQ